jgi:hypothetical protein
MVLGPLHHMLIKHKKIFILSDTSSFLHVQASKMVTCGTFLKTIIIKKRTSHEATVVYYFVDPTLNYVNRWTQQLDGLYSLQ